MDHHGHDHLAPEDGLLDPALLLSLPLLLEAAAISIIEALNSSPALTGSNCGGTIRGWSIRVSFSRFGESFARSVPNLAKRRRVLRNIWH